MMYKSSVGFALMVLGSVLFSQQSDARVSDVANKAAMYASATYQSEMIKSLRKLVQYNTVAVEGVSSVDNPVHQDFKRELKTQASALGLDYADYGYVVVIGLGKHTQRVGMITHGDVQPANPSKWAQSPYQIDLTTEPGKIIGRGTEDDKAPIVNAMYAMKSIKDLNIQLNKRIELYVYMAEESDWEPLIEFIKAHSLPQVNITLDSEYPVVTAEKGYGSISFTVPHTLALPSMVMAEKQPYLSQFSGGFFSSQIPEDASVKIENITHTLAEKIKLASRKQTGMQYDFDWQNKTLSITALGKSAHSSKPKHGTNAISHLAEILSVHRWPNNTQGALVNFINDHLGTDLYGKRFGDIAYSDDFMGPMSVQPTVIKNADDGLSLNINVRRPRGKTAFQLANEIDSVFEQWQSRHSVSLLKIESSLSDPFVQDNAPQIGTLLNVFSFYTGITDAQPVAIGGSTNSSLFPSAVSFGPTMPGKTYTGHSEKEFITTEQFNLNLKMYTAALIELAK